MTMYIGFAIGVLVAVSLLLFRLRAKDKQPIQWSQAQGMFICFMLMGMALGIVIEAALS